MLNDKQKEVCMNILYAVETGGQVYGKARHDAFVEAYTNSPVEHAITIGAGQWMGNNARWLLKLIKAENPTQFKVMDWANIAEDLEKPDWSEYRVPASSDKARCIKRILSSDVGKRCQDALMVSEIKSKERKIVEAYGEMEAGAVIECINIIHLGGWNALNRILNKTSKPYTVASIYAALCTDPADKSNNNQVGDYVSRQKKVYEMIKTHLKEETEGADEGMTESEIRKKVVDTAEKYLGCKESDGSHKKIIDVYNNHKPLARSYKVKYTDAWCATYVSAVGILCGLTDIMPTECGCGNMIELYQKIGRWKESDAYTPQPGDIIMYDWDDSGKGDNAGYPEHVGIVVSVSGDTMKIIEGNINDSCGYRTMKVNGKFIRGYCLPNYASKATKKTEKPTVSEGVKQTVAYAESFKKSIAGTYKTTSDLNMRYVPGKLTKDNIITVIPDDAKVQNYGYYTEVDGTKWLYVAYDGKVGFASKKYLRKLS